jgi:hypothetical protein
MPVAGTAESGALRYTEGRTRGVACRPARVGAGASGWYGISAWELPRETENLKN